ncbi:MAG TPA: PQQ-binding-like beta-propeller repeat protein, partial [Ktedonobacteraceae bacterium]|nr:PQQ-binding-like beta-propeller repeat protein [Ktedonobacteraceae bacterium]
MSMYNGKHFLKAYPGKSMFLLLLCFTISGFLVACSNTVSEPQPQAAKKPVLYVGYTLYRSVPASSTAQVPSQVVVAALDPGSGKKIWQQALLNLPAGEGVEGIYITIMNTFLYVAFSQGANKGQLVALNAPTGQVLWRHREDTSSISRVAVVNGNIYIRVGQNTLLDLDGKSGKTRWRISMGSSISALVAFTSKAIALYAIQIDFTKPQPSYRGVIQTLRLSDGREIWQKEVVEDAVSTDVRIQADNQAVYLLTWLNQGGKKTKTLQAFRLVDGTSLWSNSNLRENPDSLGGRLFLSGDALTLVGQYHVSFFNIQDGSILREYTSASNIIRTTTLDPQIITLGAYLYGNGPGLEDNFCLLRSSDGAKLWCSEVIA